MPIHLKGFSGEMPRMQPRYLDERNAVLASDVRLASGDLEPMRSGFTVFTAPGAREAMFLDGASWLTFTDPATRVLRGPVATDRLYITSNTAAPIIRVGATEYPLALPKPVGTFTVARGGTLDPALQELVLYTYTWVTDFGEESPPAAPLGIFWSPGCTITLSNMKVPPAGRNITKKRIYRSVTTASGATQFFFVAEVTGSDTAYAHDMEASPPAEPIPSTDFDVPPAGLRGLTAMPNGMMAAFAGKELLFCEPYQPHAWPVKYRLAVTEQIRAVVSFGSSLAVLTSGQPYIVQGIHPSSMAMQKVEQSYPCLAALGVVDMGYAAIYPSSEGLVEISEGGARLMSDAIWTREQWLQLAPATFRATAWAGRYVFSHQRVGAAQRTLGMVEPGAAPFYCRGSEEALALWTDPATGELYSLVANGMDIHKVQPQGTSGDLLPYAWRSKPFYTGRPTAMGAIYVEATLVRPGSSVTVYGDGQPLHTVQAANFNKVMRLPAGRWNEFAVEVTGTSIVTRISLGAVPDEVRL